MEVPPNCPPEANLVVAMAAEARPLVDFYRLTRDPAGHPFAVFTNNDLRLVVSGVGSHNAAAATGYLHGQSGSPPNKAWLNLGVAGARGRPTGAAYLAHKVVDRATGQAWYPPRHLGRLVPTAAVVCVPEVLTELPENELVDMESTGFLAAASRCSVPELVHVLKITSDDGGDRRAEDVKPATVSKLVEAQLPLIAQVIAELSTIAQRIRGWTSDPPELSEVLARWHFTVAQAHALRRAMRRWRALGSAVGPVAQILAEARCARDALAELGRAVEAAASCWDADA